MQPAFGVITIDSVQSPGIRGPKLYLRQPQPEIRQRIISEWTDMSCVGEEVMLSGDFVVEGQRYFVLSGKDEGSPEELSVDLRNLGLDLSQLQDAVVAVALAGYVGDLHQHDQLPVGATLHDLSARNQDFYSHLQPLVNREPGRQQMYLPRYLFAGTFRLPLVESRIGKKFFGGEFFG